MRIKFISSVIILVIISAVMISGLFFIKSESETLVRFIEKGEYKEFCKEYDKSRIWLSFLINGEKIALVDKQVEKLKNSNADSDEITDLKAEISGWLLSELPSVENIF